MILIPPSHVGASHMTRITFSCDKTIHDAQRSGD
jgi:hypothetical protein